MDESASSRRWSPARPTWRIENGTQTAGKGTAPRVLKTRDGRDWSMPRDCRGSFDTRMYSYIKRIDHRRYPVVDRSRGY